MNKIIYILIWYILSINIALADWWVLWNFKKWDWTETEKALRNWDISLDDIPNILNGIINFWLGIAWTISIIFVIVWGYKILFWSIEQDTTKWKNTIIMALVWFAISGSAWLIIKLIIDNIS